jgi:hypothetical protein
MPGVAYWIFTQLLMLAAKASASMFSMRMVSPPMLMSV